MRFVDTNIFLRFLTDDIPAQADACEALFRKAIAGEISLYTTELVIAEIVWVLESYYELPKRDVQERVEKILNTPNMFCECKDMILNALTLYVDKNIDYVDAYNAVVLRNEGVTELYSYDTHYDAIGWLKRSEP